jgi:secondary thiamine-phosphate synthase enzyme
MYQHDYEGSDDMPAHIKSCITGVSLTIPIKKGVLGLGQWQGIWLMEFRTDSHTRKITATIQGQPSK